MRALALPGPRGLVRSRRRGDRRGSRSLLDSPHPPGEGECTDQQVAVETELLLDVFADMRVIPIDARIWKAHAVGERATRRYRGLREIGHTVELVVEPDAVPVHGRR